MSFISKIVKAGVAVGTAFAAVKVSEKYKEKNPDGVSSTSEKLNAIKDAASEVISDVSRTAEEKMPEVVKTVTDTAYKAADLAKQVAPEAISKVQEAAKIVSEKAQEITGTLKKEVYDADFTNADKEQTGAAPAEKTESETKKENNSSGGKSES